MNLDQAQRDKVAEWIGQGLQPAEIQKRLADEFNLRLTYMDVRFLLDDLKLQPKDKEPTPTLVVPTQAAPAKPDPARPPREPAPAPTDLDDGGAAGEVALSVDQITRPGAVVSGKVTFRDGKSADWYLDQYGRLGLAAVEKGYKPTQADLLAFQNELQNELAKLGF
jgi:hypothetical protein